MNIDTWLRQVTEQGGEYLVMVDNRRMLRIIMNKLWSMSYDVFIHRGVAILPHITIKVQTYREGSAGSLCGYRFDKIAIMCRMKTTDEVMLFSRLKESEVDNFNHIDWEVR